MYGDAFVNRVERVFFPTRSHLTHAWPCVDTLGFSGANHLIRPDCIVMCAILYIRTFDHFLPVSGFGVQEKKFFTVGNKLLRLMYMRFYGNVNNYVFSLSLTDM